MDLSLPQSIANANGAQAGTLLERFHALRSLTTSLCATLEKEDFVVQSAPECSPAKWHLAHTTWFFENFILLPLAANYRPFHPQYGFLFNSYYETVGTFFPRPQRGLLSRPTVDDVYAYRAHVNEHLRGLLEQIDPARDADVIARVTLGIHHEQQHQELLLTDLKNLFALNPLRPVFRPPSPAADGNAAAADWIEFSGGVHDIGYGGSSFAFDNETPRHRVHLDDFALASRPVSNGDYLQFMAAGAYTNASLWLSDGWRKVQEAGWQAPLYWEQIDGRWWYMTLGGLRPVRPHEPVCHVSYFEADAYARWAGARLPTELEWEAAASRHPVEGNFLDSGHLHPRSAETGSLQFYGDVWEWTCSAYSPYPGFRPLAGSLGEYNGKFMVSQMVLRGGSCVTPRSHIRPSYRNFFYPPDRWQFTGLRLARQR